MESIKTVSDLSKITAAKWKTMSPDERAAVENSAPFQKMRQEFLDRQALMQAELATAVDSFRALHSAISKGLAELFSVPLPIDDALAVRAVCGHLRQVLDDPDVQASETVVKFVGDTLAALDRLDLSNLDKKNIASAFGSAGVSYTNTNNAKKDRLPEKKKISKGLFERWIADPKKYKNVSSFQDDLVEKQLCCLSTAIKWRKAFIEEAGLPPEWGQKPKKKSC